MVDTHGNAAAAKNRTLALLDQLRVVHGGGRFGKRDRFVKRLSYVLYEHDLDNIASVTGSCVDGVAAVHKYRPFRRRETDTENTVADIVRASGTNFTQNEHLSENKRVTALSHAWV